MTTDSRRFVPDPPPAGGDPVLMEWLVRQLERIADSLGQTSEGQDEGESAFEDHVGDKNDPHETLVPWTVDSVYFDLYPNLGSGDPGLGNLDRPVAHVALGTQELGGMEGFIADRQDIDNGGLLMMGLREVDPNNPPSPPLIANAPLEIAGNQILLMGGTVALEVGREVEEDTYLIARPSITLQDGRIVAPINLGPEVVYQYEESATDASDYDVLDVGEVSVVNPPLTLSSPYSANVSVISIRVLLNNPNRLTVFDVILKIDGIEIGRLTREVSDGSIDVSESYSLETALSAGQVISLHVEATGTHPQSQGWVRGSTQETTIHIKQG